MRWRRVERCLRIKGKGGCKRECGRRWGGTIRLPGGTGKVRRRGKHPRSGGEWCIWIYHGNRIDWERKGVLVEW